MNWKDLYIKPWLFAMLTGYAGVFFTVDKIPKDVFVFVSSFFLMVVGYCFYLKEMIEKNV